jgi:hypothetical protein
MAAPTAGSSDALQLAGERAASASASSVLQSAGDVTAPTLEACREILELAATEAQDVPLRENIEALRAMLPDIAKRPSKPRLRDMAKFLRVSQKLDSKNLSMEELHSNVKNAFKIRVLEQRRVQRLGTAGGVADDVPVEPPPKHRKTVQDSDVPQLVGTEGHVQDDLPRESPPKQRKLQQNSDAPQLAVTEGGSKLRLAGAARGSTKEAQIKPSMESKVSSDDTLPGLPTMAAPLACEKLQNCVQWLLDNGSLQPDLLKLHAQMSGLIAQSNPSQKTVRAVATALDINSRTFRQSQLRAQVEL